MAINFEWSIWFQQNFQILKSSLLNQIRTQIAINKNQKRRHDETISCQRTFLSPISQEIKC